MAAVLDWALQQEGDQATVGRFVARGDDAFEKVVGLFQLVPEHHIVLRQFELLDVEVLHGLDAKHIQPSEEPAAPTTLLRSGVIALEHV